VAKLRIVLQEADETAYWLELLVEAKIMPQPRVADLMQEANELIAIFVSSLKTAKKVRS
jgi:four helix bundle protein